MRVTHRPRTYRRNNIRTYVECAYHCGRKNVEIRTYYMMVASSLNIYVITIADASYIYDDCYKQVDKQRAVHGTCMHDACVSYVHLQRYSRWESSVCQDRARAPVRHAVSCKHSLGCICHAWLDPLIIKLKLSDLETCGLCWPYICFQVPIPTCRIFLAYYGVNICAQNFFFGL
jgi:hypothetical protein